MVWRYVFVTVPTAMHKVREFFRRPYAVRE